MTRLFHHLVLLFCLCFWHLPLKSQEVRLINYHGWTNSYLLTNGLVEAVAVPAVGRVMQLRFSGEEDGPFWENRSLDGTAPAPKAAEWRNFGGDKTWPAPQAEWGRVVGRSWPPPANFDAVAVAAEVKENEVILSSPFDPHYGIKTVRKIRLAPGAPVMTIETTYEKVTGEPIQVAVWIITQLKEPELILMPLPERSIFPPGYNKQSDHLPQELTKTENTITCTRSKTKNTKIGSDAEELVWRGQSWELSIHSPRLPGRNYPDQNSSAEIYTNADPLAYVELEFLGPLQLLKPGDRLSQTNTYHLKRR